MKNRKWWVFSATFFASIAIAVNHMKVPPVINSLLADLGIDMVLGGLIMSINSLAVVILVLPAAVILAKLGPKTTGLTALACTFLGSLLGATANSPHIILFTRCIEGIGTGLMAVAAPSVISMWFDADERGFPMGIWATWMPLAITIIFNVAHPIESLSGWRGVWQFSAALAGLAFLIYFLVVDAPQNRGNAPSHEGPSTQGSAFDALKNPALWLLALCHLGFSIRTGYETWAPTFFVEFHGIAPSLSNFYGSLAAIAGLPACIGAGWIFDRIKKRRQVLLTATITVAIIATQSFTLRTPWIAPFMISIGFMSGLIPGTILSLVPQVSRTPAHTPMGIALVNLFSFTGILASPPIYGAFIENYGWISGTIPVMSGALLMVLASSMLSLEGRRALNLGKGT